MKTRVMNADVRATGTFAHIEEQALAAQALTLSQHGQSPMSLAPIPFLSQCSIAAIGFAIAAATGVTASEKPINTASMMRSQGTVMRHSLTRGWAKSLKSQCAAWLGLSGLAAEWDTEKTGPVFQCSKVRVGQTPPRQLRLLRCDLSNALPRARKLRQSDPSFRARSRKPRRSQ